MRAKRGARRRLAPLATLALAAACAAALLSLASCSQGDGEPQVTGETTGPAEPTGTDEPTSAVRWPEVRLEQVHEGLDQPLYVTNAGDSSGRLFIVEKTGRIRVVRDGNVLDRPFLDLSGKVSDGGEQGLLGLAFAPDYSRSGEFYVNYTDRDGDTRVSRYRRSGEDPDRADPDSEEVVLGIDQPFANHNGGHLLFDRDGNLLIGTGDGGSGGDPRGNGQSTETLLGKLLRIDVGSSTGDTVAGPNGAYRIPADNPFAEGSDGRRPEIWAYGLRNPWRFSLDPATGDLYIGDVGQNAWEEIDAVRGLGRPGDNYGWNLFEGSHPFPPGAEGPGNRSEFVMPIVEYDRDAGRSVTGGVVYRGEQHPDLAGMYFYADFETGRLWGLRDALTRPETRELADTDYMIASFGYGEDGEVYVADLGGSVLRVTTSE